MVRFEILVAEDPGNRFREILERILRWDPMVERDPGGNIVVTFDLVSDDAESTVDPASWTEND